MYPLSSAAETNLRRAGVVQLALTVGAWVFVWFLVTDTYTVDISLTTPFIAPHVQKYFGSRYALQ